MQDATLRQAPEGATILASRPLQVKSGGATILQPDDPAPRVEIEGPEDRIKEDTTRGERLGSYPNT
jgi:hypothetical protein